MINRVAGYEIENNNNYIVRAIIQVIKANLLYLVLGLYDFVQIEPSINFRFNSVYLFSAFTALKFNNKTIKRILHVIIKKFLFKFKRLQIITKKYLSSRRYIIYVN